MKRNKSEVLFKRAVEGTGLNLQQSRPIRTRIAVADKRGLPTKTVTVPDFYVVDPETGSGVYVEVTNGSGLNPHKAAQLRVAEQAGITNYVQLTGDQVNAIYAQEPPTERRCLLNRLLGFD